MGRSPWVTRLLACGDGCETTSLSAGALHQNHGVIRKATASCAAPRATRMRSLASSACQSAPPLHRPWVAEIRSLHPVHSSGGANLHFFAPIRSRRTAAPYAPFIASVRRAIATPATRRLTPLLPREPLLPEAPRGTGAQTSHLCPLDQDAPSLISDRAASWRNKQAIRVSASRSRRARRTLRLCSFPDQKTDLERQAGRLKSVAWD